MGLEWQRNPIRKEKIHRDFASTAGTNYRLTLLPVGYSWDRESRR